MQQPTFCTGNNKSTAVAITKLINGEKRNLPPWPAHICELGAVDEGQGYLLPLSAEPPPERKGPVR